MTIDNAVVDQLELEHYKKVECLELMVKLKKGYFRPNWLINSWKKHPKIYTAEWLKRNLNAMGKVAEKSRLDDAYDFLTADPARSLFIGLEKARCIILITWLLYDPDSENSALNLTEFESWSWLERLPSTQKFLANYRNERTHRVEDNEWMRLVRVAWDEIQTAREIQAEQETKAGKELSKNANNSLAKSERLAYQSYEYAIGQSPELADATDDSIYHWLKQNGVGEDDYKLPSCDTWKRQVRAGRKHHGTQKNSARAGRSGGSITHAGQLQSLSEVSSQYTSEAD